MSEQAFRAIGEASRNLVRAFPEFAAAHPELQVDAAYGRRTGLAHGYFEIFLKVLWKTLREDLPKLHLQAKANEFEAHGGVSRDGRATQCESEPAQDREIEDDLGL